MRYKKVKHYNFKFHFFKQSWNNSCSVLVIRLICNKLRLARVIPLESRRGIFVDQLQLLTHKLLCRFFPQSSLLSLLLVNRGSNGFLGGFKMMKFYFFYIKSQLIQCQLFLYTSQFTIDYWFKSLPEQNRFVSSANKIADNLLVELFRSLT